MAAQWNVGDTVQLKSGGPAMTVTEIDSGTGHVQCTWFVKDQKEMNYFPAGALDKFDWGS